MELSLKEKIEKIEKCRQGKPHDLYVVAGQLDASNISQIDSWTFFLWLQDQGIPSRYILKKEDDFLEEVGDHKDVIVLDSCNKGFELLDLVDIWERACAFVVEWDLGDSEVDYWLHDLPDCRYVFLQHGVTGNWVTDIQRYPCKHIFNDVNVFSEREKNLIEENKTVNNCFIGGLPRFEKLNEKRCIDNISEKVVFVMFTWRHVFSQYPHKIANSEYWKGLKDLLTHKEILMAQSNGVRFVVAVHHSLLNNTNTLPKINNIDFVEQGDIAKWINKADMLITDFSSISFDFLYQYKPVVYWIPDKDISLYEDDSLDKQKITSALERRPMFFNLADTLDDVIKFLHFYIKNGFNLESHKRKIAEQWFDYRGNFSQRIYNHIEEQLTTERLGYKFACLLYERKLHERDLLHEKNVVDLGNKLKESNSVIECNQRTIRRLRKNRKVLTYVSISLSILVVAMILSILFRKVCLG